MTCLQSCETGTINPCVVGCRAQVTAEAQALEVELNWCLADACPNMDEPCLQAAAGGACASYLQACQAQP